MNLLYCANGIVLAWHDLDATSMSVPASAYGTGVRVIPYDPAWGPLTRVGAPPADQLHDTRPYAQPTETPQILIAFAGQVRYETVIAGIVWNSIPIQTDRNSQMLIDSLAMYATTVPNTTTINFTQNGIAYQFTASQVADLHTQVNGFLQQCRTVESQCLADLNSASPTILLYSDVEAKFSGLKSQTLLG